MPRFFETLLTLAADFPYPSTGTAGEFRMIGIAPDRFLTVQELQKAAPANGLACRLNEKIASSARTDEGINLSNEIFRQNHVRATCANRFHSVPRKWA